jgi:PAS domain S-box-containing protein
MQKHNKIFIVFAIVLFAIISTKLYKEHSAQEELKTIIIQNEVDSLISLISSFRKIYQDAFVYYDILVDDKTVNLLPVKTVGAISKEFEKVLGNRASIKTVSDRPRNINNQANKEELEIIKYFNKNQDKSSYFKKLDNNMYYYAKPLYITSKCLRCHGNKEDAPITIQQRYDKSYNYKLGDLRGITTITINKKDVIEKLDEGYLRSVKAAVVVYILFLLSIYFLIRIIVNNNKEYSRTLEEKIIQKTKELQQEKEYIHTIVESNNNAIIAINTNFLITTYNNKAQDIFGYKKEIMINYKNLHKIFPNKVYEDYRAKIDDYFKSGTKNEIFNLEHTTVGLNKDNEEFPIRVSIGSHYDGDDTIVILNISDISQIKKQEEMLLQQSKMVSMGEMIGNIAHQWRQPLSVISVTATGTKLQHEMGALTNDVLIENMDCINDNTQFLSKTIDDFKNYIKGQRELKRFNLLKEINSFLKLIDASRKTHHIVIIKDIDENININGYPNELTQCFVNLFNNSKDALSNIEEDNRFVFISAKLIDDHVHIFFKDSAKGINENIINKIFEPYFTTKHQSQGTGLGLSMTYKLITNGMNGMINVKNVKYKYNNKDYIGAEFEIILPLN